MKLRNLLFAVATCAGLFTACSNDMEDAIDNGNNNVENAEAYAAVSFVMPSAASTRAGEETAVGSSEENQVTNVTIALFDGDGNLVKAYDRERADFTPVIEGGATTYSLKSSSYIDIATAGTYSVHVIVNPTAKLTEAGLASVTTYNGYVEEVDRQHGEYCTDNNFMMTNATPVQKVTITTAHTKTNPATIQINVERLAAKITFDNNNVKDIMNGTVKIGSITFDAYKVVNTRNSAWGLRRVGLDVTDPTIGGAETNTNYVFENKFAEKENFTEKFYEENYSRKLTKYVAFRKLNTTGVQTIAYSLENTMEARDTQNKGYTTGIILRGKVTLEKAQVTGEITEDGTFYRLGNTFYGNWQALVDSKFDLQYEKLKNENETEEEYLKRISNNKVILNNKLGIELYAQGYCYYYYWLNHRPDTGEGNKEKVGMMEYAIVRNNVYALSINSVTSIGNFESGTDGAPDPENPSNGQDDVVDGGANPELPGTVSPEQEPTTPAQPVDPNDPVIDNNMYLKVTINVNPWTVRRNSIDL